MGIENPRQCELASSVDHVVARVGRKFTRLADRDNAAILDDQRAVADYSAARINSDEIVEVGNDEARHRTTKLLVNFFGSCRPGQSQQTDDLRAMSGFARNIGRIEAARRTIETDPLSSASAIGVFLQLAARDRTNSQSLQRAASFTN